MHPGSREKKAYLEIVEHGEGEPVGEHLLHHCLSPSEHQLRVLVGGRGEYEAPQQQPQHLRQVFHATQQQDSQKGTHVHSTGKAGEGGSVESAKIRLVLTGAKLG